MQHRRTPLAYVCGCNIGTHRDHLFGEFAEGLKPSIKEGALHIDTHIYCKLMSVSRSGCKFMFEK